MVSLMSPLMEDDACEHGFRIMDDSVVYKSNIGGGDVYVSDGMVVGENVPVGNRDDFGGCGGYDACSCIISRGISFPLDGVNAESYDKRRKCGYITIPDVIERRRNSSVGGRSGARGEIERIGRSKWIINSRGGRCCSGHTVDSLNQQRDCGGKIYVGSHVVAE